MPVHIFQVDETNFEICRQRGLAGIFDSADGQTDDALISHLSLMRVGDPVLFYVGKAKSKKDGSKKELYGVWQIASEPFYDTTPVWADKVYPYRVCIQEADGAVFETPIHLSDIYHLRDNGLVWTFSLMRNQVMVNAVFSMTDPEYDALYDEFLKVNPDGPAARYLTEPYPASGVPLLQQLHRKDGQPKYESSLMALLADGLKNRAYADILRHYSDYSMYVPTNWGKEIDILLLHGHPYKAGVVSSYDIVEVKRDEFTEAGLEQLLDYESWFIKKRVQGDAQMVRSIAIAHSFQPSVIEFLRLRARYEKRDVILLTYQCTSSGRVELAPFLG